MNPEIQYQRISAAAVRGLELANAPIARIEFDWDAWRSNVDQWLLDLGAFEPEEQIRVVAQLRSLGEAPERGITPLREAALAQIQAQQASRLASAASRLTWAGIGVTVVGVIVAIVQVFGST